LPVRAIRSWKPMVMNAPANRSRRGAKNRNGTTPSITNIDAQEKRWNASGRWCAYHAVHGGRHCVS